MITLVYFTYYDYALHGRLSDNLDIRSAERGDLALTKEMRCFLSGSSEGCVLQGGLAHWPAYGVLSPKGRMLVIVA